MAVLKYDVSIRAIPNKYGSHYSLIKYPITHFESVEQDRIYNNQKNMVENINQNKIYSGHVLISVFKLNIGHTLSGKSNLRV